MTGLGVVALLAAVVLCRAQPQPSPDPICPDTDGMIGTCVQNCFDSSECENGQLCCSNGCGRDCMDGVIPPVNCSDPRREGFQFNRSPCEFCSCVDGAELCAVATCALPDCGEGLEPFTPEGECCPICPQLVCPATDGMIGACIETCSDSSECENGQLCCSNGCGQVCTAPTVDCTGVPDGYTHQRTPCDTCTCYGGELSCATIACDWPQCPDGVTPVTRPGDCCPGCPTSSCTEGGNTYANGTSWTCSDGCNTCVCANGFVISTLIACPPTCTEGGNTYDNGASWTCSDGCNTCSCLNGVVASTRIACAPCTEGGNTYNSGTSWTCSDGCNTCSCSNGEVASTEIACPCTDATGDHPSGGASWICPDGCNTCNCFSGMIASTKRACAPCTDSSGDVYEAGQSWVCNGDCLTCTCQDGSIVIDVTTCSNCTEGDSYEPDPCTTCSCSGGQYLCAVIACSLPYCGDGVQPVTVPGQCCPQCPRSDRPPHVTCPDLSDVVSTCDVGCASDDACEANQICCPGGCSSLCVAPVLLTCPDTSGLVGTCVEGCSNSSTCDSGSLCCSNGCGRVCTTADVLDCSTVRCANPECEDYEELVTPEGQCCPVCQCKTNRCPVLYCFIGTPYTPEGECCSRCPSGCSGSCPALECSYGDPFTPAGECCPRCPVDCRVVLCANPDCEEYEDEVTPEGQCCPTCQCNSGSCPVLECTYGDPFTPKGECCPRCPQLACPDTDGMIGICIENCNDNSECENGQLCCSNGCGHVCMDGVLPPVNCSDPRREGFEFNRSPCEFCSCEDGAELCYVVDCAFPDCGEGLEPFTPEGECCPRCPVDCRLVRCANPDCEEYEEQVTPEGQCCPVCQCNRIRCPIPFCLYGQPYIPEGECCQQCLSDCDVVDCATVRCGAGQAAVTLEGECCPSCQDCSSVSCNVPECRDNERRVYPDTQCCPECQDCALVRCAAVECEYGEAFTPEGECCMQCPPEPEERLCQDYRSLLDVSDMDPCLRCECNADFVYECRKVTTGVGCEPLSCELEDQAYLPGDFFTEGCSSCECVNGVARCSEKGCSAVDGSGVKVDMGFVGDYDDYEDITSQEELIKVVKRQLVSKFSHLNLMESQVKDAKVYKGSVYITFTVVAMDGGADPSTVAKTLETEHRSGSLLLVSGNQTLVPLASTFSATFVAAGSNMQDGSYVAAIAVPVVVGVVAIVAIVATVIVILYVRKTSHNRPQKGMAVYSEGECNIENVYLSAEKTKWDTSSIGSDKAVKV